MNFILIISLLTQSSSGLEFLRMNVGARASGFGGAYTAIADEPYGIFYNPGGIGGLEYHYFSSFYGHWFLDTKLGALATVISLGKKGNLGIGLRGLFTGMIEQRDEQDPFHYNYYSAYFLNPSINFAKKLHNFSLGLGLNGITTKIETSTSNALFLNTGLKYSTKIIDWGLSITNLGMRVLNTNLPAGARLGLCLKPIQGLNLSLDLYKPIKDNFSYYLGIEYEIIKLLNLRLGYNNDFYAEKFYRKISFGLGIKVKNIEIDYASASSGIFGWTHFFTLSYQIIPGLKKVKELSAKEKMMSETYLSQGIEYYNLGKIDEALNAFDLALIWQPESKEAVAWIDRVQKEKRLKSIEIFLNDGKEEMSKGNYLDALYDFQKALELDSTRNDIKALKLDVEKKLKQNISENVKESIEKGLARFRSGDFLGAVGIWNSVLKIQPENTTVKGYIEEANKKMVEEISDGLKTVNLYISQNNFKKAYDLVTKLLKKYPNQENLTNHKIFIDQKITEMVNKHLNDGRALFAVHKYEDAEKEFQKVLEYEPKNVQALSYLEKMKKERPSSKKEDAERYYLLGIDAYTKNNFELAIDYWNKVIEIDPNYPNIKKNLERARIKLAELNK
uniref:PorV/PorQ family protein n=1 Tax=candidate division WOR-3 bacterium TaxID=2052148 RepID=A0A7C4XM78_UNCW3